jgi:V/A-type H+-transporting ATPase subunit E
MDRTEEKLETFTTIVLKEAARKKKEILDRAEAVRKERVDAQELNLLKEAHDTIQESLRVMGRASSEEVSRTILESKQALFTRREEIIASVFLHVSGKLDQFRKSPDYRVFLKQRILEGFQELGVGDVSVVVDEEDLDLAVGLKGEIGKQYRAVTSADVLKGGCLVINRTVGRMCDFSVARQLETEKQSFLGRYSLSVDG